MEIPRNAFVMIIGSAKAGTTSLYFYLIEHPSICPCITKEPEFFSDNQRHAYKKAKKYEDLWAFDPARHRYALEASAGYTKYPIEVGVPEKIYKYGLNPKFIYVVRDPFERILSHYNYARNRHLFDLNTPLTGDHFINLSNYFLQLEQFRRYFPRESILVLDFNELRNNPAMVLSKVYQFLDIVDIPAPRLFPIHNRTTAFSKAQLFIKHRPHIADVVRVLPKNIIKIGGKAIRLISKPKEKVEFTDQEKKVVFKRLGSDMRRFKNEYGFGVEKWGF